MKRYYVSIPVKHIEGYITQGHFEGYINAENEENVKLKLQLSSIETYLDLYIDDFEVAKVGDLDENLLIIEEMPDGNA